MIAAVCGLVYGLHTLGQMYRVIGKPNEWVLVMRNGVVTKKGIGFSGYRMPFDQVARFPSRANQVSFRTNVTTKEM